tara:strand:+ start:62 stop:325 length:264 start_codon:yes stop_codon:yes gene_type:complete
MSEDIKNKAKQAFVYLIFVKLEIIDEESYKGFIEVSDIIAKSISNECNSLFCANRGMGVDEQYSVFDYELFQYLEDFLFENNWLIRN